jgi:hypothetical protein
MHDDLNIPSDDDEDEDDMDDEDEDDDEATLKRKLNLSDHVQHSSSRKGRRKDWISLFILALFLLRSSPWRKGRRGR